MEQKKKQLKFHEKVCKKKYFRGIVTPSEKDNQNMKSDKMPSIIYVDIESLNKKRDGCANNPENSSTTKISEHIPCGYSMSKICAFEHIEYKHTLYRGKDWVKVFCTSLREHDTNAINFQNKKMLLLIKELKS